MKTTRNPSLLAPALLGRRHHSVRTANFISAFRSPLSALLPLSAALCLLLSGCRGIGPQTIARDRFNYSDSISESWKRQTLLNIVKLRYLDPPIFVDVGQIVAGYSLETGLSAGGSLPETTGLGGNTATFGGTARFTDRPTVTYTPLTGDKFLKAIMTPLPPESVFFTLESGWPADAIFFATVSRLNGLKNQEASLTGLANAEPRFLRAIELLRKIQLSDAVSMRIEQDAEKRNTTLVTIRSKDISEATLTDIRELRQLLGLAQDSTEFKLVYGAVAKNDHEIAMQTRSLLHIIGLMAAQVEVPPEHVKLGRATPGFVESDTPTAPAIRLARILSSKSKPAGAYVAVPYRDHWFWIDDCDLKSKRIFAFMMLLFTLSETGQKESPPLITIPAQ